MKLFRKDKKGVSPVIGVILMVAITVILAAVIASFVFGMGSKVKSAPQAQLILEDASDQIDDTNNDLFVVTDLGGDPINPSEITLQVVTGGNTYTLTWDSGNNQWTDNTNLVATFNDANHNNVLDVGDTITVTELTDIISNPTTIEFRVIHVPTGTVIYDATISVY